MGFLRERLFGRARGDSCAAQAEQPSQSPAPADGRAFYLVGEPGWPNWGDELIAREWLRYLAARYPDVPVLFDCRWTGRAAAILWREHPHVTFVDTVSSLCHENPYLWEGGSCSRGEDVAPLAACVRDALCWRGGDARYAPGVRLVEQSIRSVHYIGGGYMNSKLPGNLARLELGRVCAERGIPVLATGLGITPLDDVAGEYVSDAVRGFSFVGLRDTESLAALADAPNAHLVPDDCFLNALEGVSAWGELPQTMLCVQSEFDAKGPAQERLSFVPQVLEAWGAEPHGEVLGVVECNASFDRPIFDFLVGLGYEACFFPAIDVVGRGLPLCKGQRWLSSRYHPHLVAAAYGCSGAYVSVRKGYYDVKHEAVCRMGSRWAQVCPEDAVLPQPGPGFASPEARQAYAREIREVADSFYASVAGPPA